jgi:hypothetical protein
MKNFKWKLDFSFVENKNDIPKDIKVYFENLLLTTINSKFKDGLLMKEQIQLLKILDKLKLTQDDFIILEDSEFEFIEDVFTQSRFLPSFTRVINQVYTNLDEAKLRK